MSYDGWTLHNTSKALKNDKEIVVAAVKSSNIAFQHASDELKKDKECVLDLLDRGMDVGEFIDDKLLEEDDVKKMIEEMKRK